MDDSIDDDILKKRPTIHRLVSVLQLHIASKHSIQTDLLHLCM